MSSSTGANLYTQGFGTRPESVEIPIVTNVAPTSTNTNYPIGKRWINTAANAEYTLTSLTTSNGITTASWQLTATPLGDLNTLTGDTGGAISPSAGNININGGSGISVAGSGSTLTINRSASDFPISPYVVGPSGSAGYQTIQSAINAANTAGGGTIYIQPGSYTENLTLYTKIELVGATAEVDVLNVNVTGTHTPPSSGTFAARNINFISSTNIFSSASAGSASISIVECVFVVTNGFAFNLPNWTGSIRVNDCNSTGTNDGFLNNSGGATVFTNNSQLGAGSGQTMIANGSLRFDLTLFECPVTLSGSGPLTQLNITFFLGALSLGGSAFYSVSAGCAFLAPVTFTGSSTGAIVLSTFSTGSSAAVTMSSSGAWSITSCDITSSNNPAIAGSGAGTLSLGDITFTSNSSLSGTLTTAWLPTKTGAATVTGNLSLGAAGNKLSIATGSNASIGTSAALSSGTVTVSTTAVTSSSLIFISRASAAGTLGNLSVGTITAGTSFTITSSSTTDTSTVNWWIIN